ncbi:uncharacterized protein LOC126811921 isoform X2 [Patella vulgata]|uniref:uncharacterized protein LOC126811921 isoform X2 n=1 Tax=Patella vulgata TaxID=6465 RepID=UPI00217F9CE1|nr:uncharacterized protein LOC126811921 isoform X2 [Patella vulgata]
MSESLPAINIDQLTSAVNAVVNLKNVEPPSSCGVKPVRSIAPHTTSSTSYTHNTSSIISSNNQNLNLTSGNLPLMVSVQLTSSNGDATGTPLCIQQGTSNYSCNKMTSLQNIQSTTATIPLPLISLQDTGVNNTSSQTLVDLHNIHPSNPLPPFTTQTFSSQTELSHHDINCSETSISDNTVCSYNQSSCSIGQLTSQELLTIPTSSVGLYQMNSSSTANQHVLPNLIFSPSEVSTASRFFMTSPLPILSVSEKDTPISSTSHYSPRPLSVASNISGISVIDALLKPQDNVQFLAPLPPLSVDKPVSIVKPVTDLSKRLPALPAYYCVECAHTHYSPCKHHTCDYLNITDTPVLSRARQSLPSCLQLQFSKITGHFNDAGVITTTSISVMTQFGPLIGKSVRDSTDKDVHIFKHWKIFYTLDNEYQCDVLDISDEHYSNWLMFVKPARSSTEQNLVAYQCNDSIMFVTCKDIEPDSELLFWYSKEYAKLLGFMTKPNRINYCPYCFQCDKIFPDKKSLLEHKKSEHSESTFRKHQCQYCHKRFATTGKLNTHIVARHMQLKPFTCNQCGKQFSDQSNLRIHKAIHTDDIKCEEGLIYTGAVCGILALVFSTVTMILFCCSREIRKLKSKFLNCFLIDKVACCFNTKHDVNDSPFYHQVEAPQTVCQQLSISSVHENKGDSNKQAGSSIDNASVSDIIYVNQDVIPDSKNRRLNITKWVVPNQEHYDMEILENDLYESTESLPSIKQEINTSEK